MRHLSALALGLLLSSPAAAWEFSPLPVCTLTHDTGEVQLRITRDPALAEPYAIRITRALPWPEGPVLAIRYDGGRALVIQTTRHVLSDGGRSVTVTDRGFGNVLDGLEYNATATATLGDAAAVLSLDGAAPAVRAFRDCRPVPLA